MKIKNVAILAIFWVFFIILIFIVIVFSSKNIDKFRKDRYFTIYDSQTFYEPIKNIHLSDIDEISGYGKGNFSYLAYPAYLLAYKGFLNILGINEISYQMALLSNLLLLILIAVLFYKVLMPKKEVHILVYMLAFFDFSLIAFSLTLEREIFASVILALLGYIFYRGLVTKKRRWLLLAIIFFISLNVRILLPVIFIVSIIIYYSLKFFKKVKSYQKYLILILIFIILSILLRNHFTRINEYLLSGQNSSGFGSIIASLPLYARVFGYSIFYFVAPIPLAHILSNEFLYPYEYFLAFSGITYLFFWIFILKNYKYLNNKLIFLFIMVIVAHVFFGGLLFNIRHRTDIIVLLIILFLNLVKIKLNKGFTVKYLLSEFLIIIGISVSFISLLHVVYYGIKFI